MIKWAAMLTHGSQDGYNTWHGTDFHDYSGASTEKKKITSSQGIKLSSHREPEFFEGNLIYSFLSCSHRDNISENQSQNLMVWVIKLK